MNIDRIPPDMHVDEKGNITWTPRLIDFKAAIYSRGHVVTSDEFTTELLKQTYQGNYNTDTISVLVNLYNDLQTSVKDTVTEANTNAATALSRANIAESNSNNALNTANSALTISEAALNDVQTAVNASIEAVTVSENAVVVSEAAKALSESASDRADAATLNADEAIRIAETADNMSLVAEEKANTALSIAQLASSTSSAANTKSDTASSKADEALSIVNTANSNASTALTNANTALDTANTAKSKSEIATSTANNATTIANSAVAISNTARDIADTANTNSSTASTNAASALSTAQAADINASTAVTTANNAVEIANEALKNINESLGTQVYASGEFINIFDADSKLDKVLNSNTTQAYGVDSNGQQIMFQITQGVTSNTLVRRSGNHIKVPTTPEADNDATAKMYVDTSISTTLAQVDELLKGYVKSESGKGLSTNDYTTTEKNKLAGIAAGAQVNTVTSVNGKTSAVQLNASDVGALASSSVKAYITAVENSGTQHYRCYSDGTQEYFGVMTSNNNGAGKVTFSHAFKSVDDMSITLTVYAATRDYAFSAHCDAKTTTSIETECYEIRPSKVSHANISKLSYRVIGPKA